MTKLTAQTLLIFLFAFVLFASCKKSSSSSSTSGGTLTATIDGTAMTFNNIVIAKDTAYMGAYILTFGGATSLTSSTTELSLTVDGDSPITTGTYSITSSGSTNDLPAIAFSQGSSTVYGTDGTANSPCTVVITALSKTNVQGTFSGTLTLSLGSGAATKTVTDGKFNVNFK